MRQAFGVQTLLAVLVVGVVLLFPTEASACCTAINCGLCVSSSSQCQVSNACLILGTNPCPTCNVFGCNCNAQCGTYTDVGINQPCVRVACTNSAEQRDAARARFEAIDKDRNGKISRSEARAWLDKKSDKKWADSVPNPDKVSTDELFKREFDRADGDHDGVITPAELDPVLKKTES